MSMRDPATFPGHWLGRRAVDPDRIVDPGSRARYPTVTGVNTRVGGRRALAVRSAASWRPSPHDLPPYDLPPWQAIHRYLCCRQRAGPDPPHAGVLDHQSIRIAYSAGDAQAATREATSGTSGAMCWSIPRVAHPPSNNWIRLPCPVRGILQGGSQSSPP